VVHEDAQTVQSTLNKSSFEDRRAPRADDLAPSFPKKKSEIFTPSRAIVTRFFLFSLFETRVSNLNESKILQNKGLQNYESVPQRICISWTVLQIGRFKKACQMTQDFEEINLLPLVPLQLKNKKQTSICLR
jgi:hypothetical protein